MIQILNILLQDSESLMEYERSWPMLPTPDLKKLGMRVVAAERKNNLYQPDTYYDGLGEVQITRKYTSYHELFWKMPMELSNMYLMDVHDRIYVKGDMFNEWMDVILRLPPTMLLAAHLMDKFHVGMLGSLKAISGFVNAHLSQFAYSSLVHPYVPEFHYWVCHSEGLNDLHIHLNGSTETELIWEYMLSYPLSTVAAFQQVYDYSPRVQKLSSQIYPCFSPRILQEMLFHALDLKSRICQWVGKEEFGKDSITSPNMLWGDLFHKVRFGPIIEELLFCLITMCELRKTGNNWMASCFYHYLLIKSLVHQFTVMQHSQVGFKQFQLLTENTFRDGVERNYTQRFLQLAGNASSGCVGLVEGRFSPKDTDRENVALIHRIVQGYKTAHKILRKKTPSDPLRLVLIAHFIKKPESDKSKQLPIRHYLLRKELKRKAMALVSSMHYPKAGKYIVGIDAAASEFDAGPEVFAPVYRFMRQRGINHFTYHAGEDFRHLLSGLRAIVEAIVFLGLYPGDRLGHCTAVGIDPDLWMKRVSNRCILPRGEWLDDLVFAWSLLREINDPQNALLILKLESAIAELSQKTYGESFLPLSLYQAWQLREKDPLENNNWSNESSDINSLMQRYHAPSKNHPFAFCRYNYDELIDVSCDEMIPMATLRQLQILVLEKMAKRGVVIETLPSSNLRISYYRKIEEYHLSKWLDCMSSNKQLMPTVVVGSDDAGIFMTNIYNEYARVYCYLQEKGYSSVTRLSVMKTLHESGQIYNFHSDGQ